MKPPSITSLRARLTLWYAGVLAAILFFFSCAIAAVMFFEMRTQLDDHAIEELETVEAFLRFHPDGSVYLESADHDHPIPATAQERFIEVLTPSGLPLFRSELLTGRSLANSPLPGEGQGTYSPRSVRLSDGTRVRLISRVHKVQGRSTLIRLGFSEDVLWRRFLRVAAGLFGGLPIALILAAFCGHFLARRALAPMVDMTHRVQRINAEQLHTRLDVLNPSDELGRLASAFNVTLARLERSFDRMGQFTSDAAHELRTPLTVIRSVGEVALQKRGDPAYYQEVLSSILEAAARLTRLVDGLLSMARADAGQIQIARSPHNALSIVRDCAALLEVLAEEKSQSLTIDGDPSLSIHVDPAILRQSLLNLIDNSIKFAPEGGVVAVRVLRSSPSSALIEVEDNGPGIPPEHHAKVFDRFYRADRARARDTGGAGLGLAIAKWGVEANGGKLELDTSLSSGCMFRLTVPTS
jgi:heavy metal sensor kinase